MIDDDDAFINQMLNDHQGGDETIGELISNGNNGHDQMHQIIQDSNEKMGKNLHIKRSSKAAEASPFSIHLDSGVKD